MKFLKKHWKAVVALLLASCAGYAGYAVFIKEPAPKSDKPEDVAKFVASKDFRKVSDEQQREYMRKMRPPRGANRNEMRKRMNSLSEQERREMFRNMREVREKQQIEELKAYFKLSKAEREKYLDKKIAEQDKRFAEFAARRAQRQAQRQRTGNNANGQNNSQNQQRPPRPSQAQRAAAMKERIETTSPEVRAARQKYFNDMMARRKATGKAMPRPPRR